MGVWGIVQIVQFAEDPHRNGWLLASGIMLMVLCAITLFDSRLIKIQTFAFLFAFQSILVGCNIISMNGDVRGATGKGSGWIIFSGVMSILVGVFFFFTPFMAAAINAYIYAIHLIVGGVSLFVFSIKKLSYEKHSKTK